MKNRRAYAGTERRSAMSKEIVVRVETVYGNKTIYPVNDQAKRLAALAGTKTLTESTLRHAEAMGFKIVEGAVTNLAKTKDGFTCLMTERGAHLEDERKRAAEDDLHYRQEAGGFDIGVELGYKPRPPEAA
jgi:hypothetical protein